MDMAKILYCLEMRGFHPHFADNREQAIELVTQIINRDATIGFSGSMTVESLAIPALLYNRGNHTYHRSIMNDLSRDELYLRSRDCDWLITSANAMSEDGQLVNIDGKGNRVASMIYGPKNILVIIGINKITPCLDSAIERAKNIAAPLNAKRLNKDTPCVTVGKCLDCNSPDRICRATVIQTNPTTGVNFHIIIVNDNLGF